MHHYRKPSSCAQTGDVSAIRTRQFRPHSAPQAFFDIDGKGRVVVIIYTARPAADRGPSPALGLVYKLLLRVIMSLEQTARTASPAFRRTGERAFTLTEILITSAIIVVVGATAMYALSMINRYAASSRIQAAAAAVVQNQIDQILTRGPYVPTNSPPDIPSILTTGKTVTNNVPVFVDPENGNVLIAGTLTTTIQDTGATYKATPLYVLKAAVNLTYTFAGKNSTVAMDTLRAPDQ